MSRPIVTPQKAVRAVLPRGGGFLVAVSGGKDSVCLLDCCVQLAKRLRLTLEVAHVDHGFRAESHKDLKFVKTLAEKYKLPVHVKRLGAPPKKVNLEAYGRKRRYDFFRQVLTKRKLQYVLTAHTANDVAETFLMRLLSNKELNTILPLDEGLKVLRPFLNVRREEIECYIEERSLSFREDPSNKNISFLRNRVRHVLLPFLEKEFHTRIVESLAIRAFAVAEDIQTLNALVELGLTDVKSKRFGSKQWLLEAKQCINEAPKGLKWRIGAMLAKDKLGFNLGRGHGEKFASLLQGRSVALELPSGMRVKRSRGTLKVGAKLSD